MAEWMGDHGTDFFQSMVEGVKEQYSIVPSYGYVDSDVVADAYLASGVRPEANPGYAQHIRDFVVPDVPSVK